MAVKSLLSFALFTGASLWAADSYTPLDVKAGQWETTMTTQMNGAPPIPPEALARLTPEQRARMEAAIKARQGARTTTEKKCVTKDNIQKPVLFNNDQKTCKQTLVSSSRSKEEIRFDCAETAMNATGTVKIEALSSENVKITTEANATDGKNTMTVISNGTAKWVGPACTESK